MFGSMGAVANITVADSDRTMDIGLIKFFFLMTLETKIGGIAF